MQAAICDVGPRDGLQHEQAVPAPSARAELVKRLAAAGLPPVGAVASADAALEAGASLCEASVGGPGGPPFAPRATGTVATEDPVYLLHREGVERGVDLDALIGVAAWLEEGLGWTLPGQVYRSGSFAPVAG